MRIIYLITDLDVGGAERLLARMVCSLSQRFTDQCVVSMTDLGHVSKQLIEARIVVYTLTMTRGVPSIAALVRLARLLRRLKPDVLHCWMYHANLLGILAGGLAGVPRIVWNIRSANESLVGYRWMTRWVVRCCAWLSRFPDRIIIVSESAKRVHASWGYDSSKMTVISNGYDLEVFRQDPESHCAVRRELGIPEGATLIGMIARYDSVKDHASFFRAARLLSADRGDVQFVLVGKGMSNDNPEVARLVTTSELDGRAHLLGPRDDVARIMAALDIACLSSRTEAFPNAVGEAMACGVPCVVTDVGDAAFIVGNTGRVVPPENPKALAEAMREIVELAPAERRALGQKARERIAGNFALEKMVQAYESLYQGVIGDSSPRGS